MKKETSFHSFFFIVLALINHSVDFMEPAVDWSNRRRLLWETAFCEDPRRQSREGFHMGQQKANTSEEINNGV
jgi:hypothetical protein